MLHTLTLQKIGSATVISMCNSFIFPLLREVENSKDRKQNIFVDEKEVYNNK